MFSPKSTVKVASGSLHKYTFPASSLDGLETSINVFVPSSSSSKKIPVLYYLSGLTCTEDNAAQKGGFFNAAAEAHVAIVFPDTSPRGANIDGEDESYDFGSGAGFYLDATKNPWSKHYNMYQYITDELPANVNELGLNLDTSRASIFGHSMGGHGALTLYLRNPTLYLSCSAFSPICNPTQCPWGEKAFKGYLANPEQESKQYDATLLLADLSPSQRDLDILIDSGTADDFYKQKQLLPEHFEKQARHQGYSDAKVKVRLQEGYDHSYYFISTFAPEHIKWHANFLHGTSSN